MKKDILILANSRKPGGRCIAGISTDGECIRLVKPGGMAIPKNEAKKLNMLRLYSIGGLVREKDEDNVYHIENHTYTSIRDLKCSITNEEQLSQYLQFSKKIYGSTDRKVKEDIANGMCESIVFVKVSSLVFKNVYTGYDVKVRCDFVYNNRNYLDFSVTDTFIEDLFKSKPIGYTARHEVGYLLISLGELFKGYAYKLVAGVITVSN